MSQTITDKLDKCLGKRASSLLQLHLGPKSSPKRPCTLTTRAATTTTTTGTTLTMNSTSRGEAGKHDAGGSSSHEWDAKSWDTALLPHMPFPPSSSQSSDETQSVYLLSFIAVPQN